MKIKTIAKQCSDDCKGCKYGGICGRVRKNGKE